MDYIYVHSGQTRSVSGGKRVMGNKKAKEREVSSYELMPVCCAVNFCED